MIGGDGSTSSYDDIFKRAKRTKRSDGKEEGKKRKVAKITLYRNGFVVGEDGMFREKSEPSNRRFLDSLARGEVPRELESTTNERVVVELKDKRLEDYIVPSFVAFGGSGRSLNQSSIRNSTTRIAATTTATTTTTNTSSSSSSSSSLYSPKCLEVDESKPTCRVQVQLIDRSRIVVKCNETNSVCSFRNHVAFISKTGVSFELLHGFPPKPISHEMDKMSIKEAGLSGSRVIQRKAQ